ncbi:hypothetical protein QAD02_013185 [Eretmocerus hayati]|uniref:Uncharacterized protein n=1 Tax=Eretmocerus hayati TaxID=131215 RepID=A0ACC2P2R3_9HYME|nr:hypothetical protein QAD02_013185 [Eretmocerus hayati]
MDVDEATESMDGLVNENEADCTANYPIQDKPFTLSTRFWEECYKGGKRFDIKSNRTNQWNQHFEEVHEFCSGETQCRHVTGERGIELGKELQSECPTIKRLHLIVEIPDRLLEEGYMNNSSDPKVMGRIASEYRTKSDLDKNVSIFMHELTQQFKKEFPGKGLKGSIHFYSEYPVFHSLLMLEAVLKYALTKGSLPPGMKSTRTKPVFLYLDATGSLLSKLFQDLKRIRVYSLVMAGESKYPPLEVSTFASSSHITEDVCFWLDRVARNMKLLTTRRPVVDKLGTDCSLPLLQAALRASKGKKHLPALRYVQMEVRLLRQRLRERIFRLRKGKMIRRYDPKIDGTDSDSRDAAVDGELLRANKSWFTKESRRGGGRRICGSRPPNLSRKRMVYTAKSGSLFQ